MFNRSEEDKRPKWLRWFLFKQPLSATGDWWDRRDDMLRRRAPLRYFLQSNIPTMIGVQKRRFREAVWWVRHRTTDQYHIVTTELKPGYYELEQRLLYSSFKLLVEYVEIGLASKNLDCDSKDPKVRGLQYLDWEINEPQCSQEQRDTAAAARLLYLWWTVERPRRLEPWSAPEIWGEVRSTENEQSKVPLVLSLLGIRKIGRRFRMGDKSRSDESRDAGAVARATEEFYTHQDTSMLLKLVEIRSSLWT